MNDQEKIHIILNPKAANGKPLRILPLLTDALNQRKIRYDLFISERPRHATEYILSLDGEARTLIAVGGDGPVNEVVNGIQHSSTRFSVIPAGTGDDFARLLGISSIDHCLNALENNSTRTFDMGRIDFEEATGEKKTHAFINTMGIGFDAAVAHRVVQSKTGKGILPYLIAVFQTLRSYEATPVTIRFLQEEKKEKLFLASIGNGTTSGGGFILSPRAKPNDGLLDLCLVRDIKTLRVLRVLPKTFKGKHLSESEVFYQQAPAFDVALTDPRVIHADGEIISTQAVHVSVSLQGSKLQVLSSNLE